MKWKNEKEMQEELEAEKPTRDRKKYGRDGFIEAATGTFEYNKIKYIIKILRYYNLDDGFIPMSHRKTDMHAVVEYPNETKPIVKAVKIVEEYSDFLWHDTLHSFNDKQTIQEQIKLCHEWAREDIDGLNNKIIEKIQILKEAEKLIREAISK